MKPPKGRVNPEEDPGQILKGTIIVGSIQFLQARVDNTSCARTPDPFANLKNWECFFTKYNERTV